MNHPLNTKRGDAAKALTAYILANRLGPGDALPSESVLLDTLQVGRTSLREAMRHMEASGVVEVRHGSGTFVGQLTLRSVPTELLFHARLDEDSTERAREIVEVREALELGLITSLAGSGRRPDSVRLTELLQRMDGEARSGTISMTTDREFHLALYEPLHNAVATALLNALWETTAALITPLQHDAHAAEAIADRHHAILLAVNACDPRGARAAMQVHFTNLRGRLGMKAFSEDSSGGTSNPIPRFVGEAQ